MNADDERFVHHDRGIHDWINSHENYPVGTRVRVMEVDPYGFRDGPGHWGKYGTVILWGGYYVHVEFDDGERDLFHACHLLRDEPVPSVVFKGTE